MELELHQLELRYERLRRRDPRRERQLCASLAESGQLLPIVVLSADVAGRYIVVDGYKRVRALRKLHRDTALVTIWTLAEPDALLLERLMRTGEREGPLEQGWLLGELRDRFGLSLEELARRFDRSASWVSRRLALVADLPAEIHEHVRAGAIAAHAAMKHLVPLARANEEACVQLAGHLAKRHATTRQIGELYAGYVSGNKKVQARILEDPWLFLRAREEARRPDPPKSPAAQTRDDLEMLAAIARRARRRLTHGLVRSLEESEREELGRCAAQARRDVAALITSLEQKEAGDAGSENPQRDPGAS